MIGSSIVLPASVAGAAPGDQLITNPGFGQGFMLPWWEGGDPNSYETRIDRGRACFDIAGNVDVVAPSIGQGDLPLVAGRSYIYSFDASASAAAEISTSIALEPAPHTIWLDREIQLDRPQRRFSFPFVAPETTTRGAVIFRMGGNPNPTTVCLDDVTLVDAETVTNGTFDNGTTGWWNNPRATLSADTRELRVTANATTTDVFGVQVGQGGRVLRPGQRYALSFDARASASNLAVRVDVQRGVAPFTADLAWPVTLTTAARRFRVEFTATLPAGQSQIAFQLGGHPAGTVFWLDNVSLVEQPLANDPVLLWNNELLAAYRAGGAPGPLARAGAMMHGAIYDALNSIVPIGQPYITRVPAPSAEFTASPDVAVHQAAVSVLRNVFPAINFQPALDRAMATVPSGTSQTQRTLGTNVGMTAALAMINARDGDGSTNNAPYVPDNVPGAWRTTGHLCPAAVTPNWGLVRPFALTSGAQFRPPNPGGFGTYGSLLASSLYAQQLQEVRDFGRKGAPNRRTPDQTQLAFFWANDLDGTYKPPGQHFEHTRIVSLQRGLTPVQNARLFGLVAIAMADAAIVAWDRKYQTGIDLWRPDTAIQFAATNPEPGWEPLSQDRAGISFSPCFPAYTSGHATFGAAWAGIMRAFFGADDITFTGTTDDPHAVGVTRTFDSFTAAAAEDAISRVYLGVHFRFDADFGLVSGTSVAEHAVATVLRP